MTISDIAHVLRTRQRHGGSIALTSDEANAIATLLEAFAQVTTEWQSQDAMEGRR